MNPRLRQILAVLAGILLGSGVNMGLILLGGKVVPPPPGADTTTLAGLKASIHLFGPLNFAVPFLAHALGTLAGAAAAAWLAPTGRTPAALVVGGWFCLGGLVTSVMIPAPLWFKAADLLLAYFPMAWLGRATAPR